MDQSKIKDIHHDQFLYLDRWVEKKHFRAFVYDIKGEQRLANSYEDFESLTTSGIWFASKPEVAPQKRKTKDVNIPISK